MKVTKLILLTSREKEGSPKVAFSNLDPFDTKCYVPPLQSQADFWSSGGDVG